MRSKVGRPNPILAQARVFEYPERVAAGRTNAGRARAFVFRQCMSVAKIKSITIALVAATAKAAMVLSPACR